MRRMYPKVAYIRKHASSVLPMHQITEVGEALAKKMSLGGHLPHGLSTSAVEDGMALMHMGPGGGEAMAHALGPFNDRVRVPVIPPPPTVRPPPVALPAAGYSPEQIGALPPSSVAAPTGRALVEEVAELARDKRTMQATAKKLKALAANPPDTWTRPPEPRRYRVPTAYEMNRGATLRAREAGRAEAAAANIAPPGAPPAAAAAPAVEAPPTAAPPAIAPPGTPPAAAAAPAVEAPPTAAATPVTTPILPPGVSATGGAGELVPGPIVLPGAAPEVAAAPTAAAAAPRGAAPEAAAALPRPDTSYEEMSKHFSPELRAHLQSAYPGGVDPMFHASQVEKANKAVDEILGMNGLPKGWAENDTLRYISSAEDAHRAAAVARSRGYDDIANQLEEGTRVGLGRSGRSAAPAAGAAESVGTKTPQTTAATDAPPKERVWETPAPRTQEEEQRKLYDQVRQAQQRTQQEAQRLDQVEAQQRALVREQVAARDAAEREAAQGEPYRGGSRGTQPDLPPPGDTGTRPDLPPPGAPVPGTQPQGASGGSVWPWVGLGAAGLGGAYMLGRGGQREPNIAPPGR